MDREKALDLALKQIEKQFGEGAVMRMGAEDQVKVAAIPTGALSLDLALGIGGLPRGRVVELYGPESSGKSTIGLHVVAEAQKLGGIAAFIDAEHALDPVYARAIGVDVDELLVSQPDNGEQALEIADMLVRSAAVDIIVVDSVAALVPRVELEGEMGDSHVGLQARLMSQALRKLTGSLHRSKTCCVFINQLREKVGVMFGCVSWDTEVTLADGTKEYIGRIVNQEMDVEVLSYDHESGGIVPRKVVGWYDNGRTDEFLHITAANSGPTGRGHTQFACTPNHQVMTPTGWVEAQDLSIGDPVIRSVPHYLSAFQWEVLLGGLMGDSAVSANQNGLGARLRWGHGEKQAAYADWKASLFANLNVSRTTNDKGAVFHDVQPLPELAELREALYFGTKKVLSYDYLKRLTSLSIAIWYMDDGTFQLRSKGVQERTRGGTGRSEVCVEALEPTSRIRLQAHLRDTWGIEAKLIQRGKRQVACLLFPKDETDKLHALIAPYVHPSMDHKLLPKYRGRFSVEPVFEEVRYQPLPMPVTKIERRPPVGSRTHRYDIQVEGTHNYFVDGVMVHNSPETTPGGRALKFYSSVRLDVRRIESLKDGQDFVGNRVRVKVAKNKCLAAGTKVFDPTTGLTHTIEEVVDSDAGVSVWAADKKGRLHIRPITARMNQGEQEVVGLTLRDGTTLKVTPDHRMLTERGWVEAGDLEVGDRLARPRRAGTFGEEEPIPADHARLLGYLIGDGYVGGKTPIGFINVQESLHEDVAAIASTLGCNVRRRKDGLYADISHRKGEKNEVLALTRWAGIWGRLAWEKRIPAELLDLDVAEEVLANLLFGLWESDGWISREQTGGVRCGFVSTSEQLIWQIHWLLLRWGITSSMMVKEPGDHRSYIDGRYLRSKRPLWQVRVSGIDNIRRFAEALPMWGPRGRRLTEVLSDPALAKHRGSRAGYLPVTQSAPVLEHLEKRGVSAKLAASMLDLTANHARGGMKQVLGPLRLRRDRVRALAEALDDAYLRDVLDEDVYYDRIHAVGPPELAPTYDIEVEELHTFVADDVVVHNCGPPFKRSEFDILYGEGISKEGSILDVGVEAGIVKKSGAWYSYGDEQLGQGRENAREFLKEHDDIAREIEKRAKEELGIIEPADAPEEPEAAEAAETAETDGDDAGDG